MIKVKYNKNADIGDDNGKPTENIEKVNKHFLELEKVEQEMDKKYKNKEKERGLMESILHIYGQEMWHDDINIYGNRKALEDLKCAIETLLRTTENNNSENNINMPNSISIKSFVNDGEGFTCFIYLKQEDEINKLPVPYSDKIAKNKNQEDINIK